MGLSKIFNLKKLKGKLWATKSFRKLNFRIASPIKMPNNTPRPPTVKSKTTSQKIKCKKRIKQKSSIKSLKNKTERTLNARI